ncbi:MAG: c-type cytochrome [Rhodospirillales bacterium]
MLPFSTLLPVPSADADDAGAALARKHGCTVCHDPSGQNHRPQAPFIAGQKEEYLIKQMESFQRAEPQIDSPYKIFERNHPVMNARTKTLNKREMTLIAEYFSRRKCLSQIPPSGNTVALPEKGKRCVFCHGTTGINPYKLYPNIAGQKETYLAVQLRALRQSARDGADHAVKDKRFHRIMAPVVLDLTDREIEEIAAYFSRLPCRGRR